VPTRPGALAFGEKTLATGEATLVAAYYYYYRRERQDRVSITVEDVPCPPQRCP
jgi:hypothetical protein